MSRFRFELSNQAAPLARRRLDLVHVARDWAMQYGVRADACVIVDEATGERLTVLRRDRTTGTWRPDNDAGKS